MLLVSATRMWYWISLTLFPKNAGLSEWHPAGHGGYGEENSGAKSGTYEYPELAGEHRIVCLVGREEVWTLLTNSYTGQIKENVNSHCTGADIVKLL